MTSPEVSVKILINCFNLRSAGTLVTAKNLLEALARQDGSWHYTVLVPEGFDYEALSLGKNFTLIPIKTPFAYRFYRLYFDHIGIRRLISKIRPAAYLALGNIGPVRLPVPQIVLFHNPFYLDWNNFSDARISEKIIKAMERHFFAKTVRNTAFFIAQTEYMKQRLKEVWNVDDDKISVIPNALPSALRIPEDAPSDGSMESDESWEFLYVSRYYPHKNHDFLIPVAHGLLRNKVSEARLLVTIDENITEGRAFLDRVRKEGLQDIIQNIGEIGHDLLKNRYRRCTALFFPSLMETFGMPLLEAMAFGKPILAAEMPYARDLCDQAALYFDPRNPDSAMEAIRKVRTDRSLRESLSRSSLQRLKQFPSWDEVASSYKNVLRKAIGQTIP
jgi:glycosyltransferase involved in cell wall biosynthesis